MDLAIGVVAVRDAAFVSVATALAAASHDLKCLQWPREI